MPSYTYRLSAVIPRRPLLSSTKRLGARSASGSPSKNRRGGHGVGLNTPDYLPVDYAEDLHDLPNNNDHKQTLSSHEEEWGELQVGSEPAQSPPVNPTAG